MPDRYYYLRAKVSVARSAPHSLLDTEAFVENHIVRTTVVIIRTLFVQCTSIQCRIQGKEGAP